MTAREFSNTRPSCSATRAKSAGGARRKCSRASALDDKAWDRRCEVSKGMLQSVGLAQSSSTTRDRFLDEPMSGSTPSAAASARPHREPRDEGKTVSSARTSSRHRGAVRPRGRLRKGRLAQSAGSKSCDRWRRAAMEVVVRGGLAMLSQGLRASGRACDGTPGGARVEVRASGSGRGLSAVRNAGARSSPSSPSATRSKSCSE